MFWRPSTRPFADVRRRRMRRRKLYAKAEANQGGPGPRKDSSRHRFSPEATAEKMAEYVEFVRPPRKRKRAEEEEEEDPREGSHRVSRSVLDGCQASFQAADEKREKASTKFFDDTGLMALLCRHDRVLWLVNMRTPSEKQYYIFLLLETFFQHLPLEILVGFLFDIACPPDLSCGKFNFLGRYRDRISWAVSVFHAYGHHWPCQLMYHPLKTIGFGFTNGEGCERFWHSISKLIPYLRVSGVRFIRPFTS